MAENPQIQPDLLASHMPTDIPFAVSHAPTPPPLPSIQMDPDASPHDKLMQGLNQGGVPLVAPDGHPGFVHRDSLNTFLGKNPGYKTGAVVTAPDGHPGIVAHDALNAFLKSNPTYKLGQATPQTDAVLQEPRMNESRTDMLNRTVVEPFRQEMEPKSAWEEIKRDIERGINPLSNPVVQAAGNLVTEGGQKLSDLIAHEWEGVSPDTTIGKFGKNYLAPAAETAATGVLAPMAQPESIATMGAFKAPMAGAAGRLIRAGSGLAFGVPALKAAVKSGAPAVQAAAEGNTPEAVRLGTQAAFNTALAAETLGGAARETPGVVKDAANGSPYWLAKRLPESLLTPQKQVSMDIRRAAGQASNLAAGLETGGSPTGKSVQTYEDIAQPILPDVRAEAAKQGITEKDFEGRKGYKTAPKITAGVRQSYDDAYNGLLDPLRGDYAGEAAKSAAKEVVNKMLGDSALMDEIQKGDPSGRNVQALRNLRDSIANVRTVGQLDDMRQALNRLSGKYEARSEGQQYLSPLTQETLHEGANSIRNALYGEMERLYGGRSTPTEINQGEVQNPAVQAGITEDHIRELQRNHGAAIQADDLMQQTARKLSGESSKAAAPPTYWQRLRGSAAPLEMAGRPQMAATEFFRSILGFKPPDATGVFNTQMKRVIKGATADEGTTFPQGATTPEYVPGRSEGPTSSRVPGLALPAPTPFADAEVVGPRGPAQLGGSGIDQRALPPGSYEQPPSRFTPKPKELPPATLPAEFAPPTNRVEAVGIPQTAEASAVQNRFEQKPAGFTPPKRPFFMKGDVPRMPTGRPLTPEEIAVQQQPGTTGIAPDIGNWQPPPELGVTSAPDYGQKARAEVEAKMGGPLKRQSLDQSKQEVPNGQKVQAQQEGQITPKSQTGGGEQPPSATETVGSAAGAARDTPIMARLEKEHPDWSISKRAMAAAKEANPPKSQSIPAVRAAVKSKAKVPSENSSPISDRKVEVAKPAPEPTGPDDAQAFRDGAMIENGRVGKNAHDYGRVSSGIANVLEQHGLKGGTQYHKDSGSPLYWELNDLFHSPLSSMNPKMSVAEIGKAMDSVLPSEPIKVDERGHQFKTSFDMGRPADSMAKDLKEGRFASEIKSAEDNAAKMRRKADIVQSLIGETDSVKKARAAADATDQRVNEIKNNAQERIDAQQEKEAEAARALKERPMTLAKNIQPLENATWTPKTAWNGNMMKSGENTPWITDGHAAINLDFAERKAANMAGEQKFSAKVEKMREPYPNNGRGVSTDNVTTLINGVEKSATTPGEILGFHTKEALYGDKGNGYGTAYIENATSHKIIPVQASILKMVMDTMKPDAIKVGKPSDAVAFYRDGKIAAVVMPLRTEAEFHVATAKKTLADLRAQQPEPTKGKHFLTKLGGSK